MTLAIRSLQTAWRSRRPLAAGTLQAWVDKLAAQDGDALAAGLVREGEWLFVRQLPLQLRWHADATGADVGTAWRESLTAALQQAAAGHDVLRYAHRHDALADLLYRSALGEVQRQWAWARMALLPRRGLSAAQALEHGTALLLREPQAVWPVLARLWAGEAACASLSALLRGWSAARWQELLLASPVTRPYAVTAASTATAPAPDRQPEHAATPDASLRALPDTAAALQAWARARPQLVASRVHALTALMAALMAPGAPPTAAQSAQRRQTAEALLTLLPSPPTALARTATDRGALPAPHPAAAPARERAEHELPLPALQPVLSAAPAGLPTRFGGLLFWLGQLPRLGVVAPGDEPPGGPALWALARALGVPDDDPASAAFCGGSLPLGEPPADAASHAQAQAQATAQRITAWLDDAAPDLAPPRIEAVCRRAGRLHIAPGWIELRLPLASVDTAVRRLGLDLDPGWLPWLGCVVSIRYED